MKPVVSTDVCTKYISVINYC